MAAITARARLFGRSGLATHTKARGVGLLAGAIRNDQAQKLTHPRAGRCLEHAAPLRRRLVAELEHRRGAIEAAIDRSEEHTSELQSLMRNSYAVFCLKKKKNTYKIH